MKKILLAFVLLLSEMTILGQTVNLTFTGRDANNHFIPFNRVVVANVTKSWQETIFYPDTILTMGQVGIEDYEYENGLVLHQNIPNPFEGITYATLRTVEQGDVALVLTDVNGRVVETQNFVSPQPGIHQFRINVSAAGIYFLTVRQNGQAPSIKTVSNGHGATNRIEYQNFVDAYNVEWCTASLQKNNANNNAKGTTTHPFNVVTKCITWGM